MKESNLNIYHENTFLIKVFQIIEETKISFRYKQHYKNLFNKFFNFFSDKFESISLNVTQIILDKMTSFFLIIFIFI